MEWELFLRSKTEIILNLDYIERGFDALSELVVFSLVPCCGNETPKEQQNVLKPEWISMFPAVHTVDIDTYVAATSVGHYKCRLEALLDSMKVLPATVGTVIVQDGGKWAEAALNNDVKALFAESGWTAEYKVKDGWLNEYKDGKKRRTRSQLMFTLKSE